MNNIDVSGKLVEHTEPYLDVFKVLPTPAFLLASNSPLFTVIDTNKAFESLVGASEDELIGKGFFDAFAHGTDLRKNNWADLLDEAVLKGVPVKTPLLKFTDSRADTDPDPFKTVYLLGSIVPVLDQEGNLRRLLCSFTDVTELSSSQQSEKEPNARRDAKLLEDAHRVARIGSWEANLTDNTILWSELTREIYEVDPDFTPSFEVFGSFFYEKAAVDAFTALVENAVANHIPFETEVRLITARGNHRWIRITGQPEYIAAQCTRIYGVVQDITEKIRIQQLLTESGNQLQSLIQSVNGIVWEADAARFEFSFVSGHAKDILGYSPEQWLKERRFWEDHIHPDDLQKAVTRSHIQVTELTDDTFDYRMIKADGSIIWIKDIVTVIIEDGKPTWLRGLMVDITESKIIEELNILEKSVLERNATNDTSLHELVIMYLKGIETIFPEMQCSMHKVKENRLDFALAPSLSPDYLQALYNIPIGPLAGSCGTAAYMKEKVIVSDIANDSRWSDYAALALRYNLRACWSQPIINSDGEVMATLGFYYGKLRTPQENELFIIDRTSSILKVILENRQKSVLLEESALIMKQGQELAGFGNWHWDISNNVVSWSDTLYTIYGQDKSTFKATFEGYQELLHPDDRARVKELIFRVLENGKDVVFEERIVRPDGQMRHLRSWGRLQLDEKGIPVKMLGACLDITESKNNQEKLLASKSRLKNIVDAQTNYVMRMDLAGNYTYYNNKYLEDFGWLFNNELYGKGSMATVTAAHQQRVLETSEKCVQNPNEVFQLEIDKVSQNGGLRSTFWHFICLTNTYGEPFELQCIGLDITDRKKAENALKRSNERYKYVSKATNDAIYDWNVQTGHIRWGEGFTRLFGYETSEERSYTVKDWEDHIHPSERDRVLESLNNALGESSQDRWQSSYQFKNNSGSYAYVQEIGYILRESDGQPERMIGVLRDVTKQKQEEHHLKLLESVITHANDMVIIAEADPWGETSLRILYINEAFIQITGYQLLEVIGKSPLLFTGYDPDSADRKKWNSAIEQGIALQMETMLSKKDGSKYWISFWLNPVEDEKGHITHWVSIGRDISERRRYITAIEQQNETLKTIAFMQSHVVRAPLARLMGAVDLMSNYANSEQENHQILACILASAHELDGIIKDISEKAK